RRVPHPRGRSGAGRGSMSQLTARLRLPTWGEVSRHSWTFAAAAYLLVMTVSANRLTWNTWAPLAFVPILFAVTIPLLKRGMRKAPDRRIERIVVMPFVAQMLGSVDRYVLTYPLYDAADA